MPRCHVTVSDAAMCATFAAVALGLLCLLSDAWRHDRALRRKRTKRAVNQARLARMHVIDRASYTGDGRFPGRQLDHAPHHRGEDAHHVSNT